MPPAEILPLLLMPPRNVAVSATAMAVPSAEMLPLLLIPPPNVAVSMTAMALPPLAAIVLWLSILMPPTIVPVSMMPPLWNVLLMTTMPPEPTTPRLTTLPLNTVWLTRISLVTPAKVPGNGPVKGMRAPEWNLRPRTGRSE